MLSLLGMADQTGPPMSQEPLSNHLAMACTAELQEAQVRNWEATLCVISKASIILSSLPGLSAMASSTCEASSQRLLSSSSSGDLVSRSESLVLFFLLKRL